VTVIETNLADRPILVVSPPAVRKVDVPGLQQSPVSFPPALACQLVRLPRAVEELRLL